MKRFTTLSIALLLFAVACQKRETKAPQEDSQEELSVVVKRGCGSYEVLQEQLKTDPGMEDRMLQIEAHTSRVLKNPAAYRLVGDTIEIPVVVHVLYRTNAQNISDAQVRSQVTVLNEDFKNQNADRTKLPANSFQSVTSSGAKVRFVLDQIIHKYTSVRSWSTNDAVKSSQRNGNDPIDPARKLNIWVCNLGQGLLGYAQFPGGSLSTDGVVVLYSAFGSKAKYAAGTYSSPYDLGRTMTHEVGHWMNLRHIWGDDNGACSGSDLVTDTPNQGNENYGMPSYPQISCSNGPTGDMFMNYMDYTNDAGMYMFSTGQKNRMLAIFTSSGPRASFGTP